jgi:hypothetical protein
VRYGFALHLTDEHIYTGAWMFHMDRVQAQAEKFLGEPACLELDAVKLGQFGQHVLYFTVQPMSSWVRS